MPPWVGLAALIGCGGSGTASGESPGGYERVICPRCVRAGGETSDFGDGGELVPTGAGTAPAQTPCERSTTVSNIELAAARALGFGDLLDRLETDFDLPLEWSPTELDLGRPARGYAPHTRVRGALSLLSAEQHAPSLEGCGGSLRVEIAATLETADGALSIGGTLRATLQRGAERPIVSGELDLSQARGTLELDLPESAEPVRGYVRPSLFAWPDGVRLGLAVGASSARAGGDAANEPEASDLYEPLEARAPLDDCPPSERPLAVGEPGPPGAPRCSSIQQ